MIRAVLDNLLDQERKQLMHAFENGFSQYIELPKGRYVGVNVDHLSHLDTIEQAGKWSYGKVTGAEDDDN